MMVGRLSSCLVVFVLSCVLWASSTQAQSQPSCNSIGVFSAASTLYAGAPNVVFLIGNAIRLAGKPSKVWGVTGIVTGSIASVLQLAAMFGDTIPFCGDPTPILVFNSVMLAIHVTTFALGVANTYKVDHQRTYGPWPKKQSPYAPERSLPTVKPARRPAKPKARRVPARQRPVVRRAAPVPRPRPVPRVSPVPRLQTRMTCQQVFRLYRASLRGVTFKEDVERVKSIVMQMEKQYFPCFFTKREGRKLRKLRKKLFRKASARKRTGALRMPPTGMQRANGFLFRVGF